MCKKKKKIVRSVVNIPKRVVQTVTGSGGSAPRREEVKDKYRKTCIDKYGVPNPLLLKKNQKYGKTQNEIQEWLNSFGFNFNSLVIKDKEIDLYD